MFKSARTDFCHLLRNDDIGQVGAVIKSMVTNSYDGRRNDRSLLIGQSCGEELLRGLCLITEHTMCGREIRITLDLVRKGKEVKSTLCKATIAHSLDLRAGGESQLLQIAECTCRRRDGLIEVYSRDTVVISDTIINKECDTEKSQATDEQLLGFI